MSLVARLQRLPWKRLVLVLLLLAMGRSIVQAATAPAATKPVASDVEAAKRTLGLGGELVVSTPEGKFVSGNGLVEPAAPETRVAAAVAGLVRAVRVRDGDLVKAGDVLVELSSDVERHAVEGAEADLAERQAQLARLVEGTRAEDREAIAAESDAAESRLKLAEANVVRVERLAQTGSATAEELERLRLVRDELRASARASVARKLAAERGSRSVEVAQARAAVAAAKARLAQARAILARYTVRAPISGEVLDVKVRPGEAWQPGGDPLVVMGDTRRLRVRMEVDERHIGQVAVGAPAFVLADAFGERRFPGVVVERARRMGRKTVSSSRPVERQDTQVLEVVLDLEPTDALLPGLRVTSYVGEDVRPRG